MADVFNSSDGNRTAGPLRHARSVTFPDGVKLYGGGMLPEVAVAYETYGALSDKRDNAVLVCHALSGDSHVAAHDPDDAPGWWDIMIGPGKPIDTDRYFVVCSNVLGGCRGTTGPGSIDPQTGEPYGREFPTITIEDMVEVQRMLADHLGIDKLLAVVGGSMGGHQVLAWGVRHPQRVRGLVAIATSPRLSTQALAFDVVGRNAILHDPNFGGGQYYDRTNKPDVGLAIARMIGHITYLSSQAMSQKFDGDRMAPRDVATTFEKRFSVGSYLGYQGTKFVERFDANSYIALSTAMDLFDVGGTKDELIETFRDGDNAWLVMSFTSDWLFSPQDSRALVDALIATNNKPVSYCNITSGCGHDAFLLEDDLPIYGALTCGFLAGLQGETCEMPCCTATEAEVSPTSIFHPEHPHRLDYRRIASLLRTDDSVLDLGCGSGEFLNILRRRGHQEIAGVEISERAIVTCVRQGFPAIHTDLNKGLKSFLDGQFDVVVLSQTLQAVHDVEGVFDEMLRVGRKCIVSFPNFAYHKLRRMMTDEGRAPRAAGLLRYEWYNTPNIRVLSILDFEAFCAERGIRIHRRITLDTENDWQDVEDDPNANADLAIFVISR